MEDINIVEAAKMLAEKTAMLEDNNLNIAIDELSISWGGEDICNLDVFLEEYTRKAIELFNNVEASKSKNGRKEVKHNE